MRWTNVPTSTIESLGDLISFAAEYDRHHPSSAWFRGQRDARWSLQSALWRRIEDDAGNLVNEPYTHADERNLAHRFRVRAAIRRPNAPEYNDCAGWLSLMQHYGLPTRLLDWSRSPLIAAYFAIAERPLDQSVDAAVWVLNPHGLNMSMAGVRTTPALKSHDVDALVKDAFFNVTERGAHDPGAHRRPGDRALVMAAMAWEADQRMVVQQGAFTVHASPPPHCDEGLPGMEQAEDASGYLHLLRIPGYRVQTIAQEVAAAGLREGDLFPDLEHLARELKKSYPPRSTFGIKQ